MFEAALNKKLIEGASSFPSFSDQRIRSEMISAAKREWLAVAMKPDADLLGKVLTDVKNCHPIKTFFLETCFFTNKGKLHALGSGEPISPSLIASLENQLKLFLETPQVVKVMAGYNKRKVDIRSPEYIQAALAYLSDTQFYNELYPRISPSGAGSFISEALYALGRSDSTDPEIKKTLRLFEKSEDRNTLRRAKLALLARGEMPSSIEHFRSFSVRSSEFPETGTQVHRGLRNQWP